MSSKQVILPAKHGKSVTINYKQDEHGGIDPKSIQTSANTTPHKVANYLVQQGLWEANRKRGCYVETPQAASQQARRPK